MSEEETIEYFFINGQLWILPHDSLTPKLVSRDNPLYQMILQTENDDGSLDEYLKKEKNVKN